MTTPVPTAPSDRTNDLTDEDFLADFHHTTVYGATEAGGIDRQAGTPEHGAVRAWFRSRAEALGMTVTIDGIGNQYATYTWIDAEPSVLIGSHLDSQPLGGRFDGTYGVITALHAAARINDAVSEGRISPGHNLTVVDWFNEEGARFAPSIMGSSVMVGIQDLEAMLAVTDPAGVTVGEALESIGCLGTDAAPEIAAYAEIHIEQGRILEREQTTIGAVTQSWYTQKLLVSVKGEQSHTGATIMSDRHDALVAAAKIVLFTEAVVDGYEPEKIVTSVGQFTVYPNSPIVVPREVDLVIDLRASSTEDVLSARDTLRAQIAALAEERDLRIDVEDFDIRDIQHYPLDGVELTEKASADTGVSCMRIETMAGHDSVAVNRIAPSVMVFIPSIDGVSHCEREFSTDADMTAGLTAFTGIATRLVTGDLDETTPGEPFTTDHTEETGEN